MAETSYFFDGLTTGDSTLAPFDESEFILPLSAYGDCVIPEYLNELELTSATPALGSVLINTGGALVLGCIYENTASVSVAITSSAGNNRIDAIVLRRSAANNTVRITKIIGVEGAIPALPALTADDFLLGWVWIPSGFNAATTAVASTDVHDGRLFSQLGTLDTAYCNENIMHNSEFFGYSGGAAGNLPPDGWSLVGAPTAINNAALMAGAGYPIRGQTVRIRANSGIGMQTILHDVEGVASSSYYTATNKTITFKFMFTIATGPVRVTITTTGAGGTSLTTDFYRNSGISYYLMRVKAGNTSGANTVTISITSHVANGDFYVGQILACVGYVPGNYRPKHELVWFDNDVLDAAWNATAKSTGTTTVNVAASFGGVIPPYFRGLICRLRGNDSGSAAGAAYMMVYHADGSATYPSGIVDLSSLSPNDIVRESIAFIPNRQGDANAPFIANVTATGAGTFDATIQPIGIVT